MFWSQYWIHAMPCPFSPLINTRSNLLFIYQTSDFLMICLFNVSVKISSWFVDICHCCKFASYSVRYLTWKFCFLGVSSFVSLILSMLQFTQELLMYTKEEGSNWVYLFCFVFLYSTNLLFFKTCFFYPYILYPVPLFCHMTCSVLNWPVLQRCWEEKRQASARGDQGEGRAATS